MEFNQVPKVGLSCMVHCASVDPCTVIKRLDDRDVHDDDYHDHHEHQDDHDSRLR